MSNAPKLAPAKLMTHEPRADGEWRATYYLGEFRTTTAADIAAHVNAMLTAERVAMVRTLLLTSDDLEAVLSCPACGMGLVLHVQRREHDGFGNETTPRRAWLECPDHNCDEVARG